MYPRIGEGAGGGGGRAVRGHDWELALSPCGCHCANSKVGPLGSAAGDRESVTATTPRGGLQEPSREPVPNNEVHLKSPEGGGGKRKRNRSKSESQGKGRSAGEYRQPQPPRQLEFGRVQGGKEAEIPTFKMFLFSSSASLHPNPAALGPWQLRGLEKQAGKKEQHDPTCLKEGKTL